MKRFIVSLWVGVGALLAACTEEEQPLPVAGLAGTYDVTLAKDLLFVTSSDRDELRVLELKAEQKDRGYLRAPNPIEPLSIPVLPRPQALTRDVLYIQQANPDDPTDGQQDSGPYLYVRSNGSTQLSVVASGRDYLRELRRLSTNELSQSLPTPSTGPVTAFAARGPGADGLSTLYYATQEPTGARLWRVRLPGPEQLEADTPLATEPLLEGATGARLPANVAVISLLVLPQSEGGPEQLAVATRGAAGAVGKSYKVNLTASSLLELNFGGAQVLQLETHGKVRYNKKVNRRIENSQIRYDDEPQVLEEGTRIFGILDPSSCGVPSQCTGVLAVDANTGAVLNDVTGYPMLPIGSGSALPMGLSLATATRLQGVGEVPLLGIVPLSNGQIFFFDGVTLLPFDTANANADAASSFVDVRGASVAAPVEELAVEVTEGVTRTDSYVLQYQGILPGMGSLTVVTQEKPEDPTPPPFQVPANVVAQYGVEVVRPEDILVMLPGGVGRQPCADLVISAVTPPTAPGQPAILSTRTPIPEACLDYPTFQVRASGSQPFVLFNTIDGYLARMAAGESFTHTKSYFFHPYSPEDPEGPAPKYGGAAEGTAAKIDLKRQRVGIQRGERYVVNTASNYFPYFSIVDITYDPSLRFFRLPGSVVQARIQVGKPEDQSYDYFAYIAYPSADGVLEVDLELVASGAPSVRGLLPYR